VKHFWHGGNKGLKPGSPGVLLGKAGWWPAVSVLVFE